MSIEFCENKQQNIPNYLNVIRVAVAFYSIHFCKFVTL